MSTFKRNAVTVGFSGGVDSTVTVMMMRRRFAHVIAATMWLYEGQEADFDQIKEQCSILGVPHRILDFRREFRRHVVEKYLEAYESGLTPNPCVLCNRAVKYGLFLDAIETEFLALGHYARKKEVENEYRLFRSHAARKDQSYNLYSLTQQQLKRVLFPIGEFSGKDEVRAMFLQEFASRNILQKESMGACFLNGRAHDEFLRRGNAKTAQKGNFVRKDGVVLGEHQGISKYTIGQKPRVKKEEPVDGMTSPYKVLGVVCGFDLARNEVIIGEEEDVMKKRIVLSDVNLISPMRKAALLADGNSSLRVETRLSQWSEVYRGTLFAKKNKDSEDPCFVFESDDEHLMRAPAPGQAAVFYIGDELIGGGMIQLS